MKIILSPSKMQNPLATIAHSHMPERNQALTIELYRTIKSLSKKSIGELMHLKMNLLDETYALYQNFRSTNSMIHAIDGYEGVVFQEIHTDQYHEQQIAYMNDHLVILSAMYGVLQPNSPMWPYRLDMTMRPAGMNLYTYWQQSIESYFSHEDIIINLASEEFNRLLKPFQQKMIHIHFYDRKADGSYKVISYNAKQARGRMAHQFISHQLKDIQMIKEIVIENYQFEESLSDLRNFYFVKP